MEYRVFGRTGVKVSAIGMGTYYDLPSMFAARLFGYNPDRREKVAALRRGLDLGINLIDTAELYGTEPIVAEAIEGFAREEIFIATKVWPTHLRRSALRRAARRSLERLGVGYIDLYQIHWRNPFVPIGETMGAMEELVDEGLVRHIGVSNFSLPQMREAEAALSRHELASNQVEYSLEARRIEADLLPYCERSGIAVLAYRPLAHGGLARPTGRLNDAFAEVSRRRGKTHAQMALNWLLKRAVVFPIPRASRPGRVEENAGAVGWRLTPEDLAALEAGL